MGRCSCKYVEYGSHGWPQILGLGGEVSSSRLIGAGMTGIVRNLGMGPE
jgi:hypothetical protein